MCVCVCVCVCVFMYGCKFKGVCMPILLVEGWGEGVGGFASCVDDT